MRVHEEVHDDDGTTYSVYSCAFCEEYTQKLKRNGQEKPRVKISRFVEHFSLHCKKCPEQVRSDCLKTSKSQIAKFIRSDRKVQDEMFKLDYFKEVPPIKSEDEIQIVINEENIGLKRAANKKFFDDDTKLESKKPLTHKLLKPAGKTDQEVREEGIGKSAWGSFTGVRCKPESNMSFEA